MGNHDVDASQGGPLLTLDSLRGGRGKGNMYIEFDFSRNSLVPSRMD